MQESPSANTTKRRINHSPEPLGATPTFSFLAIDGWACSSGRFNLRKGEKHKKSHNPRMHKDIGKQESQH